MENNSCFYKQLENEEDSETMSTTDICLKILCWPRAQTRVLARGMTSLPAEELTRGERDAGISSVACDCET